MSLFVIDTKGVDEENVTLSDSDGEEVQSVDGEAEKSETEDDVEESGTEESNVDDSSSEENEEIQTPSRFQSTHRPRPPPKIIEDPEEKDDDYIIIPQGSDEEDEGPTVITEIPKLSMPSTKPPSKKKKKKKDEYDMSDVYVDYHTGATQALRDARKSVIDRLLKEKSIALKPGLEKMETVPNPNLSDRKLKKIRRADRAKTKGGDWFNLPAPEMTDEVKRDLELLQMRSALDPKTFYKKNDLKVLPKYFQVGRVEDNAADFYHSRVPKKDRKRTMVDELLADVEFQKRSKQKYREIVAEKEQYKSRAHKHARRLKRKK